MAVLGFGRRRDCSLHDDRCPRHCLSHRKAGTSCDSPPGDQKSHSEIPADVRRCVHTEIESCGHPIDRSRTLASVVHSSAHVESCLDHRIHPIVLELRLVQHLENI